MILLKSELKAKGCFPTALNFLFQCQMLCTEIARSRRQGSSPAGSAPGEAVGASAPLPHTCASESVLAMKFNIRKRNDRSTELSINRYQPTEVGK